MSYLTPLSLCAYAWILLYAIWIIASRFVHPTLTPEPVLRTLRHRSI